MSRKRKKDEYSDSSSEEEESSSSEVESSSSEEFSSSSSDSDSDSNSDSDSDTSSSSSSSESSDSSSESDSSRRTTRKKTTTKKVTIKITTRKTKPAKKRAKRDPLYAHTVPVLKDMLRHNNQLLKGNKADLVARINDRRKNGNLPYCTKCGIGMIKQNAKGKYYCPGGMDDDKFVRCSWKGNTVKRKPWKELDLSKRG